MTGGSAIDPPETLVPPEVWTAVSNFRFSQQSHQGAATRVRGHAATFQTPANDVGPQFALNVDLLGAASRTATNYLWYGGVEYATGYSRIGQQTGGVDSDVTPASFTAANAAPGRWTGGILNNFVPVLNDQVHVPQYYDIAAVLWQNLPNYNPTGAGTGSWTALRPYREFLVGMGLLISGGSYRSDTVYWSDAAPYNGPPGTWIAAATNQAGDAVVPGGGEIIDGAVLGEDFILYKKFASYRMRYVGGNYVMDVRPLFKGWGLHSQNCVAEHGGKHYVFTGDDLIVHDGQRWQSMLYGKWRLQLASSIGLGSFVWLDALQRELWLCLSSGSATCTTALVVDIDNGHIGNREIPNLSGMIHESQESLAAPIGLYAGTTTASTGRFFDFASGNTFDGTNITASVAKTHVSLGKPEQVKIVKWVRPWLTAGSSQVITVEVAGTMNADDSPSYSSSTFTAATDDKADVFAQGRFLHFRFGSTTSQTAWGISGFDVGYELRGAY